MTDQLLIILISVSITIIWFGMLVSLEKEYHKGCKIRQPWKRKGKKKLVKV